MKTKMYMVTVSIYKEYIRTFILDNSIADTIEEGLQFGKNIIEEYLYNIFYKDIEDDKIDLLPDKLSNEQVKILIDLFNKKDIRYEICIEVVSTDRKKFATSKELMEYFDNNIKNISNDNLYDFLLSLVVCENRYYDYRGELISSNITEQCPLLEGGYETNIDFNEEDCKKGIYVFKYTNIE